MNGRFIELRSSDIGSYFGSLVSKSVLSNGYDFKLPELSDLSTASRH